MFSAHSYGFWPGRSARQAIKAAQRHVHAGKRWVVDVDLEKFFDRVNHDALMARVARRVKDERMLGLIQRYLESGIMLGGLVEQRVEGTPQPAFPTIRLKAQVLPKAPVFGRSRSVSFLYFVS